MHISIGSYKVHDTFNVIYEAIKVGYRHIDTAALYKNEEQVGLAINRAILEQIVKRKDLIVTTKIWITALKKGYDAMLTSVENSQHKLNIDYIDVVLLHGPTRSFVHDWQNLVSIKSQLSYIKNIGVSNYNERQLQKLIDNTTCIPHINQIEFSLRYDQMELVNFCKENNIDVDAHSILIKGELLKNKTLTQIGDKYQVPVIQIIYAYYKQHNINIIIGSNSIENIINNFLLYNTPTIIHDDDVLLIKNIHDGFLLYRNYNKIT